MSHTDSTLDILIELSETTEERENQLRVNWVENINDICFHAVVLNDKDYLTFRSPEILNPVAERLDKGNGVMGDPYAYIVYSDGTFDAWKWDDSGDRGEDNIVLLKAKPGTLHSNTGDGVGSMRLTEITDISVIQRLVKDIDFEIDTIISGARSYIETLNDKIDLTGLTSYNPEQ